MTAIQVENLVKTYGSVKALNGLSLEVQTGSVFGFLGPNGAGKTTTLRILAGLAQPDSGDAWLAGSHIEGFGTQTRKNIGYLPEEPAFYPWMTPREYLNYIGEIFSFSQVARHKKTDELLEIVGLQESAKRHIGGFSRGMRQRLGLAQALVNSPEILLLDEPASALDPAGRKDVLELIENLAKTCTVLISTHILADVDRICDTVGIINKGKLIIQENRIDLLQRYDVSAIEIEFTSEPGEVKKRWAESLKSIPAVLQSDEKENVLRLTVKNIKDARSEFLGVIIRDRIPIERFEVVKPTLEDIFMNLVNGTEGSK